MPYRLKSDPGPGKTTNLTSVIDYQGVAVPLHALAVVYFSMIVVNVMVNSKVLSVLRKARYRDSVVNQLIAIQCIAGLEVGIVSLPLVVARLEVSISRPDILSVLCLIIDANSTIVIAGIYMNFVAVGLFRYMYVFYPLRMVNGEDRRLLKIILAFAVVGIVLMSWNRYGTDVWPISYLMCTLQTNELYREPWLTVIIPLHAVSIAVLALYARIYVYLAKNKARVSETNTDNPTPELGIQRHLKNVNLVGARASALTSFWCQCANISTTLLNIVDLETLTTQGLFLHYLTASLAFSMCYVPALLYCWSNEELRHKLRRPSAMWHRCWIKREPDLAENQVWALGPVSSAT